MRRPSYRMYSRGRGRESRNRSGRAASCAVSNVAELHHIETDSGAFGASRQDARRADGKLEARTGNNLQLNKRQRRLLVRRVFRDIRPLCAVRLISRSRHDAFPFAYRVAMQPPTVLRCNDILLQGELVGGISVDDRSPTVDSRICTVRASTSRPSITICTVQDPGL